MIYVVRNTKTTANLTAVVEADSESEAIAEASLKFKDEVLARSTVTGSEETAVADARRAMWAPENLSAEPLDGSTVIW